MPPKTATVSAATRTARPAATTRAKQPTATTPAAAPPPPAPKVKTPQEILDALTSPATMKDPVELVFSLTALIGLPPPAPAPPAKRTTAASRSVSSSRAKTAASTLSSTLVNPVLAPGDASRLSMRVVNASLQSLTTLVQAGWNADASPLVPPRDHVRAVAAAAEVALRRLRMRTDSSEESNSSGTRREVKSGSESPTPGALPQPATAADGVVIERAGVTLVVRCNSLGLVSPPPYYSSLYKKN